MRYLLDTCVISELVARQPNDRVIEWIDGIAPDSAYLSVITIGEISRGIERLPESARRSALYHWLTDELPARFSGRIMSIDTEVMLIWGKLMGALETAGRKMALMDSLLAATALHGGLNLVTRNEDDFKYVGVPIVNPWKAGDSTHG